MYLKSLLYQQDLHNISKVNLPWNKLHNSSLMITGASGLIGTMLIDVLMMKNEQEQLNCKIYATGRNIQKAQERFGDYWDRPYFHFVTMDVNYPIRIEHEVDFIIHAASNTHPRLYASDPVGSLMTNLEGTYNLLEYGRTHKMKRMLFLSSVEIYGQALKTEDVFDEKYCGYIDCNAVRACYPEGKRAGEALCNAYISKYNLDIVIPRLSRVYGPTMRLDDSKAMSQFLMNGVRGEDIVLKSEGLQKFSYCYVGDVVQGLLYCLLKGKCGEAYNIADVKCNMLLKDITQYIASLNGCKVVFDLPDVTEQKGFSKVTVGVMDSTKLQKLGWKPFDDLKSGIKKTIKILQYF
ncbi:NAD-dependent epimerase/dehydratase family protein [Acidaminococcus fermentans DSM 20731]|uniref:NAD-dependent epimerase/dehydratase n=1 Tax=Acidaminococcus fermentans (strain ATCC 25085 / DSM 20731 / CCUG 9996 / CIP 106432 / VR4) TaxID=591001 RepID=D2RJ83_ACIFV|nr:NAD-dependent epimerase/dehydratase family protein [Acidaminococcus fermentans]ADB47135.1 NAD-dependent epimerase/dehydratase [Acidaminococcus fermentans DSM 20731]UEA72261.1 NAD-dependent epimerase/dehydratase family protein [Acidaminococcus fermentans DSM 20731]